VSTVKHDSTAFKTVVEDLAQEARVKWVPEEFTRLRVESLDEKNKHAPAAFIGYELMPLRAVSARYGGVGEEFTQHDFWVTRQKPAELKPVDLNGYEDAEPLAGQALTIWHHAAVPHVARHEDFGPAGTNNYEGVAVTTWAGFDLKPRNFFAGTPLYP
jgi:Cu2+-containing amine oxidase